MEITTTIQLPRVLKKTSSSLASPSPSFSVYVSKDYFKFNAAHFIAFKGYREKLHGHNYKVDLKIWGRKNGDGYVLDFGKIKAVLRDLCKDINEHVILPVNSNVLEISEKGENVNVKCEDGSLFSFPRNDCKLLPIEHSSAEELAEYILGKTIEHFSEEYLLQMRGVTAMEIAVSEAPNQLATCRIQLPALTAGKVAPAQAATEIQSNQIKTVQADFDISKNAHPRKRVKPCLCAT